jgi:hypothetical protein
MSPNQAKDFVAATKNQTAKDGQNLSRPFFLFAKYSQKSKNNSRGDIRRTITKPPN